MPGLSEAPDGLDGDMQPLSSLGAGQQKIITGSHRCTLSCIGVKVPPAIPGQPGRARQRYLLMLPGAADTSWHVFHKHERLAEHPPPAGARRVPAPRACPNP